MSLQTNTAPRWEKPLGLRLPVEFWAPHFIRKSLYTVNYCDLLYLLKHVHTMVHDYSEIFPIQPPAELPSYDPRRSSTNTVVVSGHVVVEDKPGPSRKELAELAMSRRGLQLCN